MYQRGAYARKNKYHVFYIVRKGVKMRHWDRFEAKTLLILTEKILKKRRNRTPWLIFTDVEMFRALDRWAKYHALVITPKRKYTFTASGGLFTPKETSRAKERADKIIKLREQLKKRKK